jgi:N utilization substance protein B
MASRRKGRILAFQALYCWESTHIPVEELLAFSWLEPEKRDALDEGIAVFSRLLITGVVENIDPIDTLIKKHLQNWDISRINRVDLAVLRMSVYTLMFQPDIAPTIVIDEAIGIAKEFGTDDSFRFINGVLDNIRRDLKAGQPPAAQSSTAEQPCPSQN